MGKEAKEEQLGMMWLLSTLVCQGGSLSRVLSKCDCNNLLSYAYVMWTQGKGMQLLATATLLPPSLSSQNL